MSDIYIGKKYGKITIIAFDCKVGNSKKYFGKCECGNIKSYYTSNFVTGQAKSCGCLQREINIARSTTHGKSSSRIYGIYRNMKTRCLNKNSPRYKDYGGRGITICDEWMDDFMSFYNWSVDSGYKEDLTIDRINNNGNYSPSNCRWATDTEQIRNRSNTWLIEINGETKTAQEWCLQNGVSYKLAHNRKTKGWSDVDCVTIKKYGKRE